VLRSIDGGGGGAQALKGGAMTRNYTVVQYDEGVASQGKVTSFICRP
jgi:hypothetical protein